MPIVFHSGSREFHIFNKDVSYIIEIMENNELGHLYYGKRLKDRESFSYLHQEEARPLAALAGNTPSKLCLQYARQEYPSYGKGDYRYGAYIIEQPNGSKITKFEYISHKIYNGKKEIKPLPSTYVEQEGEATSIEIVLFDKIINTEFILTYTVFENRPVITRNVKFVNKGNLSLIIQSAMSACIDFPDREFEMIHLSGAWARERHVKTRKIEQGIQSVYSMRGASSAEHNPFIAMKRVGTIEDFGEVFGFSLVYSGSFLGQVEVCSHDTTRIIMGIHPNTFTWILGEGQDFQTPELVMVYSDCGLNKMSQTYHELYRTRLVRGYWRDRERPVLLNNWEATYMDFTEDGIIQLAKKAKDIGVELFVLDDGWFGTRDDDTQGLGDWYANLNKLPDGISGLSRKVEALGLKFGLWIEPEMVNKNSELYRAHPDWILSTPDRFESPSRYQHVLDYSRPEVVDAIFHMLDQLLSTSKISYIKWDMNRYITECYSRGASSLEQGMVMHKYILGVYSLYARLLDKYPELLFESCSSGGARFDPGMLYYSPQVWCSDNTDAVERLKIQYGTSMVYPVSTMGAHVSAIPNHQVNRITPLKTRGNVAYFGAFGYELDLNLLSDEEQKEVTEQIVQYKQYRKLIHQGTFYRIESPFEQEDTAWIVVSEDKKEAIAVYFFNLHHANVGWLCFKLKGLDSDKQYVLSLNDKEVSMSGSELMYAGIPLDRNKEGKKYGDFSSLLFYIREE